MKLGLSAAFLLVAVPALSQMGPGGPGMGHGPMGFGSMRTPVTNAPYTATFTSTTAEKLQDGTVLNRSNTRTVERDSLGRTREEETVPAHGDTAKTHTMIVILDPVAHTLTQLRPDQKIAVVRMLPQSRQGTSAGQASAAIATDAAPDHARHQDRNVVKSDLGSKTIAGLVATGTRMTRTIPAGEMGNATALVSTRENWFSPDLKIEMSRTEVDPFHGTTTMTVSALSRTEPDAGLFTVPSDYKVQQAPDHAGGRHGFGGPRGGQMPPTSTGSVSAPGM